MNYITKLKLAKHKSLIATIIICGVSLLVMVIGYIISFFELNRELSIALVISSTFTFILALLYCVLFRAIANYYIARLGEEERLEEIETTTYSVLREDISKQLKVLEILKEYLTIDEKERKLKFKGNITAIVFPELKMFNGNKHYDLLKEVLL